jgi:hypothetical protein
MAIINKTGITNGGTIQAEHVTRAIDALSGGSTDTIVATGSFSGSLTGVATSASFATIASMAVSSSFATTASFALNAGAGTGFPFTGSARITGSLGITGSLSVVSSFVASGSHMRITATNTLVESSQTYFTGSGGKGYGEVIFGNKTALNLQSIVTGSGFTIPTREPTVPTTGSMYFRNDEPALYIYDGNQWVFITLGT